MNRSKLTAITLFAGLFILFLASCGTAGPFNPDNSQQNAEIPTDKENSAAESEAYSAPAAEDDQVVQAGDRAAGIEPAVQTVGSDGIAIGFTQDGRAFRGNPAAPVVIEEFSDFQCPYCARFTAQTLPSLDENQIASGEVLLIYYDFPLESIHPQAFAAANAARCAGEQGIEAYWQMHDLLYADPQQWSNANHEQAFIDFATELEIDVELFSACVAENRHQDAIQADIDLALSRGVRSTPSFFVNGQSLVGAQPLQVFDQAIATVMSGESLATAQETTNTQPDSAPPLEPPRVAPTPAAITEDTMAAALGDENAPVTIVEFSDYQCPYCLRHVQETMPTMLSELIETGRVRYVFKDLPLDGLHPEARAAANAARCAGELDAYWEMHDALFESQAQWAGKGDDAQDVFISQAEELGLDVAAFTTCLEEQRHAAVIQQNVDEARSLGASATPYFFIDGLPIAGAQQYELFFYAVELAEVGLLADAYAPGQPDIAESYSIGDPNAPVTIIEYTDFQCPYCSRHYNNTFGQIKENFIDTGKVRYVFKDFPLTNIHPQALKAAEAARCAGDQGAFEAMHKMLFSNQGEWQGRPDAATIFTSYAVDLGLDNDTFDACLSSGQHEAAVYSDLEEGSKLGVNGTPAFFINGHFMSGAQPYSVFEQAINQFLEEQA